MLPFRLHNNASASLFSASTTLFERHEFYIRLSLYDRTVFDEFDWGEDLAYCKDILIDTDCDDTVGCTWDGECKGQVKYAIAVKYESNPYWGWAIGASYITPESCNLGDLNCDGNYNVLDIVTLANCILAGSCYGRVDDASEAALIKKDNLVSIEANGFIGGVQMTLSHGSDFSIEMTDRALFADYLTTGNETRLLVITPESEELFSYNGEFEITEIIVANSQYEVSVVDMPIATSFRLSDAYPNPFNPETRIRFQLAENSNVRLMIYDVLGRKVRTLVSDRMDAGNHVINWDGLNDAGTDVASGMYVYRIKAGDFIAHRKMLLVR